MFVIRNAVRKDLKGVLGLAAHLNSYNLPADAGFVRKLLRDCELSFLGKIRRKEDLKYLFVAEEISTKKLVGCSLIIARHGTPRLPHLSFQIGFESKTSRFLSKRVDHYTLKLHSDPSGYTEIGGLVVLPKYRELKEKLGKQLSFARFAYIAGHLRRFKKRILVEYLPKIDPEKGHKLWDFIGHRFTGLSYKEADKLSVVNKEFILSLFPKEKIYCAMLPDSIVRNLGSPGPGAKKSLGMLSKIGFHFLNQVDPFDGGPHYAAPISKIPVIRKTVYLKYTAPAIALPPDLPMSLVMRESGGNIKSFVARFKVKGGLVSLPEDAAKLLGLKQGDEVSLTPFQGGTR